MRWQVWLPRSTASRPISSSRTKTTCRTTGAHTPFSRPGFDPVLNLGVSYIWHLCAFRRERALALGVYSDHGAEFCHDWDTVVRFAEAGRPIVHVPHVLYHWRTHAASQSHTDTQNPGSIASTRAVLERAWRGVGAPDALRDRRVPAVSRRRRMVDPAPAGRRALLGVVVLGAHARPTARALGALPGAVLATDVVALSRRLETLDDWRDARGRHAARRRAASSLLDRHGGRRRRNGCGRRPSGSSSSRTRRSCAAASWTSATSVRRCRHRRTPATPWRLYRGLQRAIPAPLPWR